MPTQEGLKEDIARLRRKYKAAAQRAEDLRQQLRFLDLAWAKLGDYEMIQLPAKDIDVDEAIMHIGCDENKDKIGLQTIRPGDTVWRRRGTKDCVTQKTLDGLRASGETQWPLHDEQSTVRRL